MSYAEMAAKGPKQRAHPVPEIEHSEPEESPSLVDVDSVHVHSVKSDFEDQEVKTQTQATRLEHEAEDEARAERKKMADQAEQAKKKATAKAKEAKKQVKQEGKKLSENRDNPVVIGNAVLWGVGIVAIGAGAYQKHKEGQLDWSLAGTVAGVVAVVGVADYFGSKWLTENKYPLK